MIADAHGVAIYYEVDGPDDGPAVMLVAGQGAQCTDWDDDLIDPLIGAGYRIIRFDNRDSGLSAFDDRPTDLAAVATGDLSTVRYSLNDMANDGFALLDALAIEAVHLVGHSMGAMIAQCMAIARPNRVKTLTSIAGSTGCPNVGQPHPGIAELFLQRTQSFLTPDEHLEALVKASATWSSMDQGVTIDDLRSMIRRRMERTSGTGGSDRQVAAIVTAPDRTEDLSRLTMPVLVIHGADDPLIDVSGGVATAQAIPGADYLELEGVRHDLPPTVRKQVVEALLHHFEKHDRG